MWVICCLDIRTPYVQEQVNIGSGPPGSRIRWFRSSNNEPRFINTVTFDSKADSPTLVMVHGYGASQGFFFRNFDALASRFRVIAIDQLGWASLVFYLLCFSNNVPLNVCFSFLLSTVGCSEIWLPWASLDCFSCSFYQQCWRCPFSLCLNDDY